MVTHRRANPTDTEICFVLMSMDNFFRRLNYSTVIPRTVNDLELAIEVVFASTDTDLMTQNDFTQLVQCPTDRGSLLDHLYTNHPTPNSLQIYVCICM